MKGKNMIERLDTKPDSGQSVITFYNKLRTCKSHKQALSLFLKYAQIILPVKRVSLHLFEDENPFIKKSYEVSATRSAVYEDVRSYLTPQDIDVIWNSDRIKIITPNNLQMPLKRKRELDMVIPLCAMGDKRGFLIIEYPDREKERTHTQSYNAVIQLAGCLASYLSMKDKTLKMIEKDSILHETKEYVSSILENMVHGVISIDTKGIIITFSRGAELLLELDAGEVISHHYHEVFPAQISKLVDELKTRLVSEKYIIEREAEYIMQGKFPIPIKFTASLLKDKNGQESGLILICKDSSSFKRLIALQELGNMKSEFLATASHEFKTPLNLIMGSIGILSTGMVGAMNEKQQKLVKLVEEGSNRLHQLINDLLDISKMEHNQKLNNNQQVSISTVLTENLQMQDEIARGKNITLTVKNNHPELTITGTRDKIYGIFDNLIGNAIKYTPDGGAVHVEVDLVSQQGYPESFYRFSGEDRINIIENAVQITVSDTGIGIAKENFDLIFDKFHRVNDPYVRQNQGTGLGLAITRKIIDSLGGIIRVESEQSRGSKFIVQLPLNPPVVAQNSSEINA